MNFETSVWISVGISRTYLMSSGLSTNVRKKERLTRGDLDLTRSSGSALGGLLDLVRTEGSAGGEGLTGDLGE